MFIFPYFHEDRKHWGKKVFLSKEVKKVPQQRGKIFLLFMLKWLLLVLRKGAIEWKERFLLLWLSQRERKRRKNRNSFAERFERLTGEKKEVSVGSNHFSIFITLRKKRRSYVEIKKMKKNSVEPNYGLDGE